MTMQFKKTLSEVQPAIALVTALVWVCLSHAWLPTAAVFTALQLATLLAARRRPRIHDRSTSEVRFIARAVVAPVREQPPVARRPHLTALP